MTQPEAPRVQLELHALDVPVLRWPAGWPIPRVGDKVSIPRAPWPLVVREVDWLIEGTELSPEPRVLVVLERPRPRPSFV